MAAAQAVARLRNWDREPADDAVIDRTGAATTRVANGRAQTGAVDVDRDGDRRVGRVGMLAARARRSEWRSTAPRRPRCAGPRGVRYTPSTGSTDPLWLLRMATIVRTALASAR